MPYSFIFAGFFLSAIVLLILGFVLENKTLKIISACLFGICFLMFVMLYFSLANMN